MNGKAIAAAAGVVVLAEVLRRRSTDLPAQVNEAAARAMGGIQINPCGTAPAGAPRGYVELLVLQKQALGRQFGTERAASCAASASGPCFPVPSKAIPTATVSCTLRVMNQWRQVANSLADNPETVGSLKDDLEELGATLLRLMDVLGRQSKSAPVDSDTNKRVWSTITRLAIALAGVHIHHGDAEEEAREDLGRDLVDPTSYLNVLTDLAGWFLTSKVGPIVVIGGVVYVAHRKGLL